jgi:hypothetical protein
VTGPLIVRHANPHASGALTTVAITGSKRNMIDAPVSGPAPLCAHAGAAGSNALPVWARVPISPGEEWLILTDAHDLGGQWIAIRICHTSNGNGHEFVVRRPQFD